MSKTLRSLSLLGLRARWESPNFGGSRQGSNKASFDEIESTAAAVEGAKHRFLLNHTNKSKFIGLPATVKDAISVGLNRRQHRRHFNDFYADEAGQSRTLRGYVNAWLKPVFRSYDTVALNAL